MSWTARMSKHLMFLTAILVVIACERGEVVSGSVQVICGPERRPCNLHIVAPIELRQAAVSIDGEGALQLLPDAVEHPIRRLLPELIGLEPDSETSVLTCHLK